MPGGWSWGGLVLSEENTAEFPLGEGLLSMWFMSKGHSFKDADSNETTKIQRPFAPTRRQLVPPKEEACPPPQENTCRVCRRLTDALGGPSTQEDSGLKGYDA